MASPATVLTFGPTYIVDDFDEILRIDRN